MRNRLKEFRLARQLSLQELADLVGTTNQQISHLEKGKRKLTIEWADKIAQALHINRNELWSDTNSVDKIPLVGYVGAGAEMHTIDDHIKGDGLEQLEMPIIKRTDISAKEILAVRVKGDSMLPLIRDGWTIYFHIKNDPESCLKELCVVKLTDGRHFIKELRKGSRPNRYNLISFNASEIEDVEIAWAYKIISIEPR